MSSTILYLVLALFLTSDVAPQIFESDGSFIGNLENTNNLHKNHTMDGNILCGGSDYNQQNLSKQCMKYEFGEWTQFNWTLNKKRISHSSWKLSSGEILLFGGEKSPKTSEIVTSDGSTMSFDLKYETM